jgi:hypothetical protein
MELMLTISARGEAAVKSRPFADNRASLDASRGGDGRLTLQRRFGPAAAKRMPSLAASLLVFDPQRIEWIRPRVESGASPCQQRPRSPSRRTEAAL